MKKLTKFVAPLAITGLVGVVIILRKNANVRQESLENCIKTIESLTVDLAETLATNAVLMEIINDPNHYSSNEEAQNDIDFRKIILLNT